MYPSTFKELFPSGIGYDWQLTGSRMSKKLMTSSRVSKVSLEWLDYMSEDKRFRNSFGDLQPIQHAWNLGEKQLGHYKLDGFCTVDNTNYVLEFNGCLYHSCVSCGYQETPERQQVILLTINF